MKKKQKTIQRGKPLSDVSERVSEYWNDMETERRLEIKAVAVFTLALIVTLAMASHYRDDLAASPISVGNWIGLPGAYVAWSLHMLFGVSGWLVPPLLVGWGILIIRKQRASKHLLSRALGSLVMISSFCAILSLIYGQNRVAAFRAGGVLGAYFAQLMSVFGGVGSFLVLLSLFAVAVLMTTDFLFRRFFEWVQNLWKSWWVRREREPLEVPKGFEREEKELLRPDDARRPPAPPDGVITMGPAVEVEISPPAEEELEEPVITVGSSEETITFDGSNDSTDGWIEEEPEDEDPEDEEYPEGRIKIVTVKETEYETTDQESEDWVEEAPAEYRLPPLSLLNNPDQGPVVIDREEILENSRTLERTLEEFGIRARVVEVNQGPVITRYELAPPPGVKVSKVTSLADNMALALRATHLRILAPIPGKAAIGVEIPNRVRREVYLREILASEVYRSRKSKLTLALGKTLSGDPHVADLKKMPHLLIAGATGSGKSVCVNTIIASIMYRATPDEVKFLLIDPKRVEMKLYNDIPHLVAPVVWDPRRAAGALRWTIEEMEQRYIYLSKAGVRDLDAYNEKRMEELGSGDKSVNPVDTNLPGYLPHIVVFIDELADLMMVARNEVEAMVVRLAQMARAVGMHLVIATQRPSVNVITGIIKANFPTRIAFQVSSKVDSRTILDGIGAEALMGQGDMLFSPGGAARPIRLQGSLITTPEVERLCDYVKEQRRADYLCTEFEPPEETRGIGGFGSDDFTHDADDEDLYHEALEIVLQTQTASTSLLQRRLKIGYGRAARLLDQMHESGIVGPPRGSKPRKVLAGIGQPPDDDYE
jgi:S-DNA-T family DNA segregation ATPase FtsK/SpoIIIE